MNPKLRPGQFFGSVLKERRVVNSILTEYAYPPETRITRHSHALPYFSIILRGAYDEIHGNKLRECKPAMLFFHPAGELHADRFRSDLCRVFSFELGTQWLERAGQCSLTLNDPVQLSSGVAVWLASRLYRELYVTDAASSLVVEGLLLEIVAEVARYVPGRGRSKPPGWLEQAKDLPGLAPGRTS
jgi:AraC family transcriptional regulator